jgi:hypothetical protein
MLVDLVYNHPRMGWLKAPSVRLHNTVGSKGVRGTIHTRLPLGRYAIRVVSPVLGVDAIVFENGEKLTQTTLGPGTKIIELDDNRQLLEFREPGSASPRALASDIAVNETSDEDATTDGAQSESTEAAGEETVPYIGPGAPEGHGLVYVVVRFAKQNDPYGEPPQEEFELAFQMHQPEDYDEFFAQNFHLVEQAEPVINPLDPMSFDRPDGSAHRLHRHCHFSGCKH